MNEELVIEEQFIKDVYSRSLVDEFIDDSILEVLSPNSIL